MKRRFSPRKMDKRALNGFSLRLGLLLIAVVFSAQSFNGQEVDGRNEPVADPAAVVALGHARFSILTPQLIRMEWSADSAFEDRASLVFLNRHLPVPAYSQAKHAVRGGEELEIRTASLTLRYRVLKGQNGQFSPDNLSVTLTVGGQTTQWKPGLASTGNLLGTTRTLDGSKGDRTREPIAPGLISRDGWAVVDDSSRPLFDGADFSFPDGERSPLPWVKERSINPAAANLAPGPEILPEPKIEPGSQPTPDQRWAQQRREAADSTRAPGRQDWYFFGYSHDYKLALRDYTRVAGRIPLPPRFAFGAWWSRYWAYSDRELVDLVGEARSNNVPLDVLVVDMDWHTPFQNDWSVHDPSGNVAKWTGYTWNNLLFPYPEQFLTKMHNLGLKVTLNLHPASGVQPFEERYAEMARAMGIDPATKEYVPFHITDKQFARNYLDILHHPLERQGIDFWWLDWQQLQHTELPHVDLTWWLNYVHFTDQQREGKRPLLFHRWGGLGNHRYQIGFSGDVVSVWDSLAFQPWFTATAANVGYAYWSHDIGGHKPGEIAPELYARWLQFGALSPILRTHTTKNAEAERRIWAYPPPYSDVMKEAYQLRYKMLPYVYTEARRTYDTGVAFVRPLYYEAPEQPEAYERRNEYMFGDNMVVAPITSAADPKTGLTEEEIWLPPGSWIEVPTGTSIEGGKRVRRSFSLSQIPMYVKYGSIFPSAPPMLSSEEKPLSPLGITVYPLQDGQTTAYSLYEDAGNTDKYKQGEAAWTDLQASRSSNVVRVQIAAQRGSFPGNLTQRSYRISLPFDWPPDAVTVNGLPVSYRSAVNDVTGWHFEGSTLSTIVQTPSFAVGTRVTIEVRRNARQVADLSRLRGFAGQMIRLREAYDQLNQIAPIASPPNELVDAMQAGDRLEYHPELAGSILEHYWTVLPTVMSSIDLIDDMPESRRQTLLQVSINSGSTSQTLEQGLREAQMRIQLGRAAVANMMSKE